ncbi:unnamed protein product [Spirodela intermedia]|uniref:Uncharacterized protein n=2 Tax=Spirodela intermedia TaxID=51605 RepID=A0A7I8J3L2_SPIIN|nr:unnamed protein product [Spirodela intermedia]CAA6664583.1 unnamed protein product [Spirodela intermedia]
MLSCSAGESLIVIWFFLFFFFFSPPRQVLCFDVLVTHLLLSQRPEGLCRGVGGDGEERRGLEQRHGSGGPVGSQVIGGKREVFWMRDPNTGNWIPENRFGDVDAADLREILLSKK